MVPTNLVCPGGLSSRAWLSGEVDIAMRISEETGQRAYQSIWPSIPFWPGQSFDVQVLVCALNK